jgi:PhnB protein
MQINTYLTFNGQCKAAFDFYAQCLGGKIDAMFTFGESPMAAETAPEWRDKVMHAQLNIGGNLIMGSDAPPQMRQTPQGFSVSINVDSSAEAERIFNALADNGKVQMPIQETFWALRFGVLVDSFGTPWMINCLRPCEG